MRSPHGFRRWERLGHLVPRGLAAAGLFRVPPPERPVLGRPGTDRGSGQNPREGRFRTRRSIPPAGAMRICPVPACGRADMRGAGAVGALEKASVWFVVVVVLFCFVGCFRTTSGYTPGAERGAWAPVWAIPGYRCLHQFGSGKEIKQPLLGVMEVPVLSKTGA